MPAYSKTTILTSGMLRKLLMGESIVISDDTRVGVQAHEMQALDGIRVVRNLKLDESIGPFEMGIIVGKTLNDLEKIKDAETRLESADGK